MARILLLKMYGDNPVVVNTRNIALITKSTSDPDYRCVWTTDGEVTNVLNPIDDIVYAWRHGKDAGDVKVFDDGTV